MRNISKKVFLNSLACRTLGWMTRSGEIDEGIDEPSLSERFRIEQGIEVGRRARELYRGGFLVDDADIASASEKTRTLMGSPAISTIFEGAFAIDRFTARADILEREGEGWHLIEVKSSINDKEEFIDDMAYTAMVIKHSGIDVSNVSLLLVSKDFRLGMKNEKLFGEIDHTDEVLGRVEEIKPYWETVEKMTRSPVKPEPELRLDCRKCKLFEECLRKDIENHIFDIPRLSQSKFVQLTELGIVSIEDIPGGFPLTKNQVRVRDCVRKKELFIGHGLKRELDLVSWPAYYLDFETFMTAIPFYPDIAPYTQLPTQYSIHKCSEIGHVTDHHEYLADPNGDCRREIAENLVHVLKGTSSIIVYSSFEKTVIKRLAALFPDLASDLNRLADRIIDLEAIIRRNFYHPDFHGRTSIKITLPVLVTDMSYDELKIANGDSAMAAFGYLALGRYQGEEAETVKSDLLEYCKQDTLATVRLHQQLVDYMTTS